MDQIFIEIDADVKKKLKVYCAENGVTIKDLIRGFINKILKIKEDKCSNHI